jgi:hypothetical protein
MPFKSEKQRRYMWSQHPDIARRWAREYPTDSNLGKKKEAELPDPQLPVYRGENAKRKARADALRRRYERSR